MDLLIFAILLAGAYLIGTKLIEKKHYLEIKKREKEFLHLPAISAKNFLEEGQKIKSSQMVYGSIVVSIDYFKLFWGGLKKVFGGEVYAFESVLDRGRREAILRMKESAREANIILNTRIETSTLGKSKKGSGVGCSEVLAYGTAVHLEGPASLREVEKPPEVEQKIASSKEKKIKKEKVGIFTYIVLAIAAIVLILVILLML